jgi:hypothetical protein
MSIMTSAYTVLKHIFLSYVEKKDPSKTLQKLGLYK